MSAELKKLAADLHKEGYVKGSIILGALAPALRELGLIPDNLGSNVGIMSAPGRKFGSTFYDVDINRLREIRRSRDWSQATLAHQANLSKSFVSTVERGKHKTISRVSIERLASALGISVEDLLKTSQGEGVISNG